jgi:hypothetical protein
MGAIDKAGSDVEPTPGLSTAVTLARRHSTTSGAAAGSVARPFTQSTPLLTALPFTTKENIYLWGE